MTTIKLKNGSGAPTAGDLVQGEPALDLTNKRLYTEDSGGTVIEVGTNPSTINIDAGTIDGAVIGGSSAAAITGTTITGTSFVSSGNMTFGDNDKAVFGAGSDLQIYHDGSNSYIQDNGTGALILEGTTSTQIKGSSFVILRSTDGENMAVGNANGSFDLYHNNVKKLATTSTGIDVTGTVTADGLTVTGTNANLVLGTSGNDITFNRNADNYINASGGASSNIIINPQNRFVVNTGGTERMRIDSSGQVGIGTSSPEKLLHLKTSAINTAFARIESTATNSYPTLSLKNDAREYQLTAHGPLGDVFTIYDGTAGSHRLVIDSSGNVGIGTSSPSVALEVDGTIKASGNGKLQIADDTEGSTFEFNVGGGGALEIYDGSTERMRLDSSGNLLVGTTSESTWESAAGFRARSSGSTTITRDGNPPLYVNRLNSDGTLLQFQKGTAVVGSIGVDSGDNLYIAGSAASHGGLYFGTNTAAPLSAGTLTDDVMDLGTATYRFDDVYATNGTINTSDRNEKQDIEALSDAEQRVAVACKGLLRKFRWKSSVADKGDEARIHFGIIAQDLQDAFTAEGLDAGRYAMFINSTWTDEETGEERSRMGVRYSELLAFIIAAI